VAFVTEQFARVSPKLATLATRAVAERWIDVGPRPGKEGGGFCAGVGKGQSRILLNYAPTYLWMSATAHELGHAYHNGVLEEAGRTWLQRSLMPSTLAETASTFCETLVHRAALADVDAAERLTLLGGVLLSFDLNVFNPVAGFTFERDLFAARRERALSIDELGDVSLAAQRSLFGDALDPATISPYTWAETPHPFIADQWYYNFPYAFGMLLAIGLYAEYLREPAGFWPRFDEFLAGVGTADAAELAERIGIDLRAPAFWGRALDVIRADIGEFERLVEMQCNA
jgi:oligoendopeptidase F